MRILGFVSALFGFEMPSDDNGFDTFWVSYRSVVTGMVTQFCQQV
jgi:hypothetical protein